MNLQGSYAQYTHIMASPPSFTKRMRIATRGIHDVSDHLVNAKLGLGEKLVKKSNC